MFINQLRLFTQKYGKINLSSLFLAILVASAIFPLQAQSQVSQVEITQALTDTQKQDIKKQAEEFIELLGKNKSSQARAILAKKLQKNWTPEQIQALWEAEVISQFGPFQKVIRSKAIDIINADVVKVTTQFAKGSENILVTFNKNQEVIAVNWPSNKSVEKIAEAFVNDIVAKDYARARGYLSPALKTEFFAENIEKSWTNLLERTGPFQKILAIQHQPGGTIAATNVVIMKIQFEKVTDNLFIFFNQDKQIVNVDFPE
ncbi:MAG: DUF3887 domain-containing protein [Snowella sp.]|nr:MAG: DUF3887 domain-containing protein [Snowella sp.]